VLVNVKLLLNKNINNHAFVIKLIVVTHIHGLISLRLGLLV
jgi:hypothetical protein